MGEYRTKSGKVLTDEDIQKLADEAEVGYDVSKIHQKKENTMGEMAIMDQKAGDLKVIWDPNKKDEVKAAKEQFDTLLGKGYMAYAVGSGGKKGEQVREFDKTAERLILAPALRGG